MPAEPPAGFTHLGSSHMPHMVDVGGKAVTHREARASATIQLPRELLEMLLEDGANHKGPILETCVIAAIAAVKKTADMIPLCHPLPLTGVEVLPDIDREHARLVFSVSVQTDGKTGVEMEALHGASVAALTFYDMVKSRFKALEIGPIRLEEKQGGSTGTFKRKP